LLEQGHYGLPGRAVHLDRFDLGNVGDGCQLVPSLEADIRTDNLPHPIAARQVEKGRLALHAQAAQNRDFH